MRIRTIALTCLLLGGMALAPGGVQGQEDVPSRPVFDDADRLLAPRVARGQDYAPPDPQWPLPLFHDRPETGGVYTFGEFVIFRQTNPLRHQLLAIRGFIDQDGSITGTPGSFFGDGSPALNARQAGGPGTYQPGFNIGIGYRFRDGSTAELSWMHLLKAEYSATAAIIGGGFGFNPGAQLQNTFLTSPVFNFPVEYAGPAVDTVLGNPGATFGIWNASDLQSITFWQRTEQIQAKFRKPVWETDCYRCYGLIGLRFFWIWESFRWRVVDENVFGASSAFDTAVYTNVVSNRMYGPFIGFGQEWLLGTNACGAFSLSLDLEAAMLLDVVKQRAKYELGESEAPPQAKRSVTSYKGVPELSANVKLWWYPIEGVQVSVGWDFMAFFNTRAARNPVSFNFGGLDPPWESTARVFDGFRAGIGFIW